MPAASIIVDLLLKTGSFITDTDRSAKALSKLKKEAYDTGRTIGDSLGKIAGVVGLSLTVAGMTALVKSSIDAADHLNDLSKRTGIAVESLGGLGFAATNAGIDLDSVAAGAGKLNKQIAAAAAGNQDAIDLFKAMGISVRDAAGQVKTADQVLLEMAGHFEEWADGPEKGAIALRAFGKAGEAMIPLLDDGAAALQANIAYYQKYAGVTTSTAQKADQFNDTLGKLSLLTSAFGRNLSSELLTPLQGIADALLEAKEKGDGMKSTAEALATAFEGLVRSGAFLGTTIAIIGNAVGGLAAQMGVLFRTADERSQNMTLMDRLLGRVPMQNVQQAQSMMAQLNAVGAAAVEDSKKNVARLESINAALDRRNAEKAQRSIEDRGFTPAIAAKNKPRAPLLPDKGAQGEAAAIAMKQYDEQIAVERDFAQRQKATFDYANKLVDDAFGVGLTSLRSYFGQQQALRDAALASQQQAADAEVAILRRESTDQRLNPTQRADATKKLADAERRRADITQQAARENVLAYESERRAVEGFASSLVDLQAQVAEGSGDTQLAASLRASQQLAAAMRTVTALGADPGIVTQLQLQLQGRADLQKLTDDYSRTVERARDAEDALMQSSQAAGLSEIDTLRAVRDLRQRQLAQMGELVKRANELALATGSPDAIRNAEQLSAAYGRALAELDPVLAHIRDIGQDVGQTLAGGLADAALEGDGLLDTLHKLDKQLTQIALNELFTKPFKQWVGNMVGGTGAAGSGGGLIGSIGDWIKGLGSGGAGAGAAGASAGGGSWWSSALSSAGGWLAGLFGGGMASGGMTLPQHLYEVGEKGPEVFNDGRRQWLLTGAGYGRIDPDAGGSGGGRAGGQIVNQTFVLPARIDKRTQSQVGAASARGLAAYNARNN